MNNNYCKFQTLLIFWLFLGLTNIQVISAKQSEIKNRKEISQYGITWIFEKPTTTGQFINGDWWVVGPVTILSVSPRPHKALPTEKDVLDLNSWGDTGLQNDTRRRNGSMVVMVPGDDQGYDSRGITYKASSSITFPYKLDVNRSLISSISNDTIPGRQMCYALMWGSEENSYQVLRTAAVLTCLTSVPPVDAFRPTYIGGTKTIYTLSQIQWNKLLNLTPTASMPSWEQFERYFERPWIDHLNGNWPGQWLLPSQNQAGYGREFVRMVSIASLMLNTNGTHDRKQKLLIGLLQYGIDIRGIAMLGGNWNVGGGHTSGRKWPVIFAGIMLNDSSFFDLASSAIFHEDVQTYYGKGWAGQKALWQMVMHHGTRLPYMHVSPDQWRTYDGGWAQTSEEYRLCCTIKAWVGQDLAALLMGAKKIWNHNAYFDNVEDWMRQNDTYAANRQGYSRPSEEKSSFDIFVNEMWAAYRSSIPTQANGETNLLWNPFREQWIHNDTISSTMSPTNLIMKFTGSTDSISNDDYSIYKNSTSDNFIDGTSTEKSWPRSLLIP